MATLTNRAEACKPSSAATKKLLSPSLRFYARTIRSCRTVQLRYLRRGQIIKALRGFKVDLCIIANLCCAIGLLPKRRLCEFCGWTGFAFVPIYYVDRYRSDVFCPNCRLSDRYRTLVCFLRRSDRGTRWRRSRPRVLEIAPVEASRKMMTAEFGASESVSFDLSSPWADVLGDLQELPFSSNVFDIFLCYEVLDYIPDDVRALSELRRVLKSDGCGILRVGFDQALPDSVEYSEPDPDDSYHIRRYGRDLLDRFHKAGFDVEIADLNAGVPTGERKRLGLDDQPVFFLQPR